MNQSTSRIHVEYIHLPVINYAMQQNRISLIRKFTIRNTGEEKLNNLNISLTTDPYFADAVPYHIDTIQPGETVRVEGFKLNLSTGFFVQLTEKMAGTFLMEITADGETIYKNPYPVDILAFDQWGGVNVLPEMLSSFITPNHPAIIPVIQRAAVIMEKWTGNPSLDEYQSRTPDRVRKQMAAIYIAIAEQNITYASVPPSFEAYGQRVRMADQVQAQKLGNCLDMSLLYAACLEAIGIHPLIIITHTHAFAGGWLKPETFPDSVIDDVSSITTRTADGINEICLVEATGMNTGQDCDFDRAEEMANNRLNTKQDFVLAIDVKRSRFAGINPLPLRILNGEHWEIDESTLITTDKSDAVPTSVNPYDLSGINTEIQLTKQLVWERKLLDLSLRNNLLNIRVTKNTMQLISVDIAKFEDALANGDEFSLMPKPDDWQNPAYDFGLYHKLESDDPVNGLIRSEINQKRLRTYLTKQELSKALPHLYRSSRLSVEENGANTLYLALGLLKWYETPGSQRPRYAPILLFPVEMIRKSAAKGYIIRSREEDSMMNITLLEMLRQNFGITIPGLDPLPRDEYGLDVKLIYSIIRNSIKDQPKWDVEEQAILGIFSFNKFIMWNDIHNNAHKLMENKIVSSLVNGLIEWELTDETADASILENELAPTDLVLPISADSSQFEAIHEAVNDKSFILHGPPGTGKSQTITNIIANALYKGKRVLFVAEKMAALSVVQSRLEAIGLSPFCLELHSNKTKKSTVLEQLRKSSEVIRKSSPEDFGRYADRLHQLRTQLNAYVNALHKKYLFGLSFYDAITRYLSIETDGEIIIPQTLIETLDKSILQDWEEAVDNLAGIGRAFGHPHNHPLTGIRIHSYSEAIKEHILTELRYAVELLSKVKDKTNSFIQILGATDFLPDRKQTDLQARLIEVLSRIPELTPAILTQPRTDELIEEYREVIQHGKKYSELQHTILADFTEDILNIDSRLLLASWNNCSNKWFLPRAIGQRKIRKQLNMFATGKPATNAEVRKLLTLIISYQDEKNFIAPYTDKLPEFFGRYGKQNNIEWDTLEQIVEDVSIIHSLILRYSGNISLATGIKNSLSQQLTEGTQVFKSIHGSLLNELRELLTELPACENRISKLAGIQTDTLYSEHEYWIDSATARMETWIQHIGKLKEWYQWLLACDRIDKLNLRFVADEYKDKNLPTESLNNIFAKAYCKAIIHYIIGKEPDLELFKGKLFDDIISRFRELAGNMTELTKKELYARLAANIPDFTREAVQNSEVGILQRNLKNNARGISIRRLFDQIPTLLSRMCPCMLMSPISVAQYIDPEAEKFDLIVFDEASQMPTYEAIGAIARGNNIVIVGDPRQLPPTSFFSVNTTDEDNIEMEDLESILDDCLALSMPSRYLLWHYRSKHESLIAFSNSEYYENKLLTFPSPDNIESKVRLVKIDGYYDKGKSRQNRQEAEAVIKEIERRLSDSTLRKKSIGVVTFSSVQQTLIEDLLSDLFIFRPDLETLALECDEPLFIKNLENVQGDERDIILFSVGYGPDAQGKISMNFGPLNRIGGERRLNVAVSRARYEMIIFSTLRPEQIDLNRTSAIGVAGLKRFLEYAERGERMTLDTHTTNDHELTIENVISKQLRNHGYTVHTNIGCSGYKVNVGIVDDNNPSSYILGILCDGEDYRQTKTVRDREIVQTSVLQQLGWNIFRIWTMDWWENPQEVIDSIKAEINGLISSETDTPIKQTIDAEQSSQADTLFNDYMMPEAHIASLAGNSSGTSYRSALLRQVSSPSPDDFFLPGNRQIVTSQIKKVISEEAPISRPLLCRRVLAAWNITRLGTRLDAYFDTLLQTLPYYITEHEGITFYWETEEQYKLYSDYRINSNRDPGDLPPEELANGIKHLLEQEISMPSKDLVKATAQLFGFFRSGTNIDAAMYRGIKEAIKKGYAKMQNNKVTINS